MSYRNDEQRDRLGNATWASDFLLSLGFLSRLPVATGEQEAGSLALAMRAFPLAGAVIGLLAGLVMAVAWAVGLPAPIAALLSVTAGVLLTGALHEDGLADMADGLGGGADTEDALGIMRDSRIGSFGVIALVLALGLKVAALASILAGAGGAAGLAALLAAGAWSRAVLPALMHALPPARSDGLGVLAGIPARSVAVQAGGLAWVIGLLALWPSSILLPLLLLPIASLLGVAITGWLADRRIGGHTGDVVGAAQVVSELLCLIACAWMLGS